MADQFPSDKLLDLYRIAGCGTSMIGAMSIKKSHEYYRRTVVKKTAIEHRLGLHDPPTGLDSSLTLAIGTTKGQGDHLRILNDPEAWVTRRQRPSAITFWLRWVLWILATVDFLGGTMAILMVLNRPFPGAAV